MPRNTEKVLATGSFPAAANTFSVFLGTAGLLATRGQICYGNLNVKLAGAYCGLSDSYDGATHHACEDLAAMRALPNMHVLVPADAVATQALTRLMLDTQGPVYIRLSREACPDVYSPQQAGSFQLGKGAVLREGSDVTVMACGIMVSKAMEAAEQLAQEGISVRAVDLYSIKPIDRELILRCARETGAIVCAEEHSVIGGLGSAVAEVLAGENQLLPVAFVGVKDVFTESGNYDELLHKYGLDADAVVSALRKVLAQKN